VLEITILTKKYSELLDLQQLAAIGLKKKNMRDFVLLERSADIGGTWRDNSYPGAEVDVPAGLYSISFIP
jgi:cation diffusion facilitator CzcD-associated flavoprotein CzcO